jgi:hypothetical protein
LQIEEQPLSFFKQLCGQEGKVKPDRSYWEDFKYLVARELDIDLEALKGLPTQEIRTSGDFGNFISEIQSLLESSRDSQVVIVIRPSSSEVLIKNEPLCVAWAHSRSNGNLGITQSLRRNLFRELPGLNIFIAYMLGEAIGFIAWSSIPAPNDIILDQQQPEVPAESRGDAVLIHYMHASQRMHKEIVSYRLIRQVVEKANTMKVKAVLLNVEEWSNGLEQPFLASGFEKNVSGKHFVYDFRLIGE